MVAGVVGIFRAEFEYKHVIIAMISIWFQTILALQSFRIFVCLHLVYFFHLLAINMVGEIKNVIIVGVRRTKYLLAFTPEIDVYFV